MQQALCVHESKEIRHKEPRPWHVKLPHDALCERHVTVGKSVSRVAKEIGEARRVVQSNLERCGIKRQRDDNTIMEDEFRRLRVDENITIEGGGGRDRQEDGRVEAQVE